MTPAITVFGGDEKGATDWAKEVQIAAINSQLFSLVVANKSGSDFYVQIFDLASSANANTTVPIYDVPVISGSFLPFSFAGGLQFRNGIYARAVTTQGGTTLIASSDAKFTYAHARGPIL